MLILSLSVLGCVAPDEGRIRALFSANRIGVDASQWMLRFEPHQEEIAIIAVSPDRARFERTLPLGISCEEMERAVELMLWVWTTQWVESRPRPAARRPMRPQVQEQERQSLATWRLGLGVGPMLVVDTRKPGLGGLVFADARFRDSPFQFSLGASGHGARTVALGTGKVQWYRLSARLAACWLAYESPLFSFGFRGGALGGVIGLEALGFEGNPVTSWDVAGLAGVQADWFMTKRWGVWLSFDGLAWVMRHRAVIDGVGSIALPPFEFQWAMGIRLKEP